MLQRLQLPSRVSAKVWGALPSLAWLVKVLGLFPGPRSQTRWEDIAPEQALVLRWCGTWRGWLLLRFSSKWEGGREGGIPHYGGTGTWK